jgi:DNA-binding PadR family transcriptional regulator
MQSPELFKGTLSTIVLKLLHEHGRMYGYEMTQKVKLLTRDAVQLTEGSLYPALHKLEVEGLVKSEVEYIGKRPRKYYSLTNNGRAAVKEKVGEFAEFVKAMQQLLGPLPGIELKFQPIR